MSDAPHRGEKLSQTVPLAMASDLPPDENDPPNALPRGTLLNDKFRVQRVIGVGGFGIVYLAHDEMSDVDVAIKEYMPAALAGRTKTMHVSLSSQSNAETFALGLKSFWNEARLLAKFRDEHLPLLKVYDAFQANGTAYMVMPVLRGRTAHQLRRDMAKPPTERWLRTLLNDLLPALERLHAENVYHRDIAPDNIQIDINGKPVLMDLGAARHVISNRTQSITAILKPGYAPIEQYGESDKLRQGPWTDIYALGATLHFLLLNKSPSAATARIFDTGTPLVQHDLPDCSPAFLRVIDWMLEPKPEARPQSVEQLRTALADSDDATVVMAPKKKPPPELRVVPPALAAPTPAAAKPGSSSEATVLATPAQPLPVPSAPRASLPATQVAGPAAMARASTLASLPASSAAPPAASAGAAAAHRSANERSPLPLLLAGVGLLALLIGTAVWLWPSAPVNTAIPSSTSAPGLSKVEPTPPASRPEPSALPAAPTMVTTPPPVPALTEAAQPPPVPAVVAAPAPAATASAAPPPDNEATRAAATPPRRAPASSGTATTAATPLPAARKAPPVNDKDGALLPKPAEPSAQAPVAAAPAPVPSPPAPASAVPAPAVAAPAPAPAGPASPSARCSDSGGSIARRLCVAVVCGLPELHNHPECLAVRGK
jgi:serine/threonine protein kinase